MRARFIAGDSQRQRVGKCSAILAIWFRLRSTLLPWEASLFASFGCTIERVLEYPRTLTADLPTHIANAMLQLLRTTNGWPFLGVTHSTGLSSVSTSVFEVRREKALCISFAQFLAENRAALSRDCLTLTSPAACRKSREAVSACREAGRTGCSRPRPSSCRQPPGR